MTQPQNKNELSFEQVLASRIITELAKPKNERKTLSEQIVKVQTQ